MTDIRELLREATDDLALQHADPVSRVRRGTTRRRRTMTAIGCIVIAVIVAIIVPLAVVSGRGASAPAAPSPTPVAHSRSALQDWAPDDIEAAAGFGSIWGLSAAGNGAPGTSWVDQLNPETGARIRRISIPAPTARIAVGAGRVWVIGQNAGGGGTSYITTIDPTSGETASLRLTNPRAEPYDIAFSAGSAWVTMQLLNQVWRLTPWSRVHHKGEGPFDEGIITVSGGPTDIATTGSGAIWVQRVATSRLTHLLPTADSGRIGQTVGWPSGVFGASGRNGLLAIGASGAVGELIPSELNRCDACAQVNGMAAKGAVLAALRTPRGVFVSTTRRTYFYSAASLAHASNGTPTASIPDLGASLAADGPGVVLGAGDGGLVHWIPAF